MTIAWYITIPMHTLQRSVGLAFYFRGPRSAHRMLTHGKCHVERFIEAIAANERGRIKVAELP